MRLEGKVTIVTGGGSGMGRTASERFAREGARVVVADVGEAPGEAAAAAVRAAGGEATCIRADVSNEDDARRKDAYTASKGAVLALTRSLAVQSARRGVRSNSISPGPIETPLLMDWLLKDEAAKQLRLNRNPSGRFGKPEEIVSLGNYLASDESRLTNGANFVDDGGITVNSF